MIKPIKITPLRITKYLYYKCDSCKAEGTMYLENSIINTDEKGNAEENLDYECPECGKKL